MKKIFTPTPKRHGRQPVDESPHFTGFRDECSGTRKTLPQYHGRKSLVWGFTNLKIRRAKREDLPEIIKIIKNSYHRKYAAAGEYYSVQQLTDPNYETENGPYYSLKIFVESMIAALENKLRKPFNFFVAKLGKKLIAFIIIEKNRKYFWVNNIMVKKEFQGQDIGERLFEFAVKNKKPLYLWVNSKNPAKKFWSRIGFKEVLQETLMFRE